MTEHEHGIAIPAARLPHRVAQIVMNAVLAPLSVAATSSAKAATGTLSLLVPTDFSELGRVAVDTAIDLANRYSDVKLTLLHVVVHGRVPEYPDDDLSFAATPGMNLAEAKRRLENLKSRRNANDKIDTRVLEGDPARVICDFAQAQHVQAIVLSSHGTTQRPAICLGSVAELVVQRAACPVLVIKPQRTPEGQFAREQNRMELRKILVGYDHRRGSKRALAMACAIARESHATLTLIHALASADAPADFPHTNADAVRIQEATEWLRQVAAHHKSAAPKWMVLAAVGKPWEVILDAAATDGSDLIVVGPHEHTRWGHCFVGSTAQRVVHLAPCSVLAVK